MILARPDHHWLTAPTAHARDLLIDELSLPPLLGRVDADARLRGPYTAAGSVVRRLGAEALAAAPDLVAAHDVAVLTVAPELRGVVSSARETLTSLAPAEERTRFYAAGRTASIAHGVVEFVRDVLPRIADGPRALVVENADAAEATDIEWLALMLRRIDPARLRIVVCTSRDTVDAQLRDALPEPAARRPVPEPGDPCDDVRAGQTDAHTDPGDTRPAAQRYVASDCADRDGRGREAYERLAPPERAALHDARADELEARGEESLKLGAIPFHRERGSDPVAGAKAVLHALERCTLLGFYEAVIDLATRAATLLDWEIQPEDCWLVTAKATTALTALGRAAEAEALYDEACAACALPAVHLQAAYGRAMLYTRFFEAARLDHMKAKGHINTAIALSQTVDDAHERAFNLTVNENGLALIEMHLGDGDKALDLVTAGLDRLDAELDPGEHALQRSILRYNRAQLLAGYGRPEEALAEYTLTIAADPHHSEYHFERAGIHRRLGMFDEALDDYAEAIRVGPPYPEPHYNRADLALELGDVDGAIAGYSYVLELDPAFGDARLNRASLLLELGDIDGARRDVDAGLTLDPQHAHLHALRGVIAHRDGWLERAHEAFADALRYDPRLVAAWSNRAVLWYEQGEVDRAIDDLTSALEVGENPDVRANRALAYEAAGRLAEAAADRELAGVVI
jgi:tetratricopeptide (TPR) repeat protein